MKVMVTGSAGFIGAALSQKLLERGDEIIGLDNLNEYYDVKLKLARLAHLQSHSKFTQVQASIENKNAIQATFARHYPQRVVNLAAQAGVRYSLRNPHAYVDSNLVGFINILEACRRYGVEYLVYASSSSVYGANTKIPFSIHDNVNHPISLYAATKKANELMAHAYSHLYDLPTTGLRFFTVYGPWGRPDMALFKFTRNILVGDPIDIFNYGRHRRDFTYIDDVVEVLVRVLDRIAMPNLRWDSDNPDPASSKAPYCIYNIGNHRPIELIRYIEVLEDCLGRKAIRNLLPMQIGDVPDTYAEVDTLIQNLDYQPSTSTSIEDGVARFVDWYLDYYRINS